MKRIWYPTCNSLSWNCKRCLRKSGTKLCNPPHLQAPRRDRFWLYVRELHHNFLVKRKCWIHWFIQSFRNQNGSWPPVYTFSIIFPSANKQHILSKSLASPISWPRSLATYSAKVIAATRLGCVHTTTCFLKQMKLILKLVELVELVIWTCEAHALSSGTRLSASQTSVEVFVAQTCG